MDYNTLVRRLQSVIYAVRRGQTNKVLATFLLALIAAAEYLRREWKEPFWVLYFAAAAYLTAGISALWLIVRLWKVAAPPPEISDKAAPSAIKGLLPWGVADGELFTLLGRRAELQSLLDRAQNDQIPITVVRGESGVGKTSLLQAGLQYALKRENCVYWEARPENASNELLHAIRNQFPEINSLDSLPVASKSRWILILDQFEQLRVERPEHAAVFHLLERIAGEPAPHRLSAVIGFRREYQADWSDFELAKGYRAEQIAVKLMPLPVARDVIATLVDKAGFSLEQELVENFLASIAQSSSQWDGISPLDLSIGVDSLVAFAQQRGVDYVTMKDYQLAGGAEGLLLVFVEQKLDEVPESLRVQLLKGIVLSLLDLQTNQRVPEGETGPVIANHSSLPVEVLKPWLERLTNPRVRLLEKVEPDRYRLPHERLVPILRRLTGTTLASMDRTRLTLESEYMRWRQTRSRRNLLRGKELAEVVKYREHLIPGKDAAGKAEYFDACVGRRRMLRLSWAGVGTAVAAAAYGGYRYVNALEEMRALRSWDIPAELLAYQHRLDALFLYKTINDLSWLSSTRLRELHIDFRGSSLADLERLDGLANLDLDLRGSTVASLATLAKIKRLTTLTLHLGLSRIGRFGESGGRLTGLEQLIGLTTLTLDLNGTNVTSLSGLERLNRLKTLDLDLSGSRITNLAELKQLSSLTSLTLIMSLSNLASIFDLGQLNVLTALRLLMDGSSHHRLAELERLENLTTLTLIVREPTISGLAELRQVKGLTTLVLDCDGSTIRSLEGLQELKSLTELTLDFGTSSSMSDSPELMQLNGVRLPGETAPIVLGFADAKTDTGPRLKSLVQLEHLTGLRTLTLRLGVSAITDVSVLRHLKDLKRLTLYLDGAKVNSLAALGRLQNLRTLTLGLSGGPWRRSGIHSLAEIRQIKGLSDLTLDLSFARVNSLAGLGDLKDLNALTLVLNSSDIKSLAGLEELTSLTTLTLNLDNSEVSSLAELRQLERLTSLTLSFMNSPIDSLVDLPYLTTLTSLTLELSYSKIKRLAELQQLKGLSHATIRLPLSLLPQLKISAREKYVSSSVH